MFNIVKKEIQIGDNILTLETGKIARQAHTVIAQMGGTIVMASVVVAKEPKEGVDFFPLTVNYIEKYYAAGRFPGGFFKREGRPSERETLISRLIDRPIRPLFPSHFYNEVQLTCTLISYDPNFQPDIVAIAASSAALSISPAPFYGPIAASRVCYNEEGGFYLNPSAENVANNSKLDLVVAGTKDAVFMVESEASELSEELMLEAVVFGQQAFAPLVDGISEFASLYRTANPDSENWMDFSEKAKDNKELIAEVEKIVGAGLKDAYSTINKQKRNAVLEQLKSVLRTSLIATDMYTENKVMKAFKTLQASIVRHLALDEKRIDGRSSDDIRAIDVELDLLPCAHGSALFTRGETQALVVTTLGTADDEQMVDDIDGVRKEKFTLHYNFPSYSVGEIGRVGSPGRREIGHGKLAYRAIRPLMPAHKDFPYTVRVVSEITESNGSSSMASVCGASLALMAAGVPVKNVAGIAMGLIKEDSRYVVLSDIMGDEDYLGDMDFKVAGTADGITALQMDIKTDGITEEIMKVALSKARKGRMHILNNMSSAITVSRSNIASNAPQIKTINIPKEKIGELIGPGGKVIKGITEKTGVKIDISDDGTVNISSISGDSMQLALEMINETLAVVEVGNIYKGKVVKLVDFGAFVSITRGTEGLVHISEISNDTVKNVRDILTEGQDVDVKVVGIDPKTRKIKLSIKALLPNSNTSVDSAEILNVTDVVELDDVVHNTTVDAPKKKFKKNMKKPSNHKQTNNKKEIDGNEERKLRFF